MFTQGPGLPGRARRTLTQPPPRRILQSLLTLPVRGSPFSKGTPSQLGQLGPQAGRPFSGQGRIRPRSGWLWGWTQARPGQTTPPPPAGALGTAQWHSPHLQPVPSRPALQPGPAERQTKQVGPCRPPQYIRPPLSRPTPGREEDGADEMGRPLLHPPPLVPA